MIYKTHITTSLALGTGLATIAPIPYTVGYLFWIVIGSLLPDIDEPNSYVGRRTFGLAKIINAKLGHRGLTHSLLTWVTLTVYCLIYPNSFTIGISLGYLFHIAGDFFSVSSVPLLAPISSFRPKYMTISYKTNGFAESIIFYVSIILGIYLFLLGNFYEPLIQSTVYWVERIFQILLWLINIL